jgi:hypothetical protein
MAMKRKLSENIQSDHIIVYKIYQVMLSIFFSSKSDILKARLLTCNVLKAMEKSSKREQ